MKIEELFKTQKNIPRNSELRGYSHRLKHLNLLMCLVEEHEKEILKALEIDLKKPEIEAFASEVHYVKDEINFTRKRLKKWMRDKRVKGAYTLWPSRSHIRSEPFGVCLIIGPWNYPFQLLLSPLIGAIAAGNTAILKPSELAPNVSAIISKLIQKYFDPEIVSVVEGGIPETQKLLELEFDKIFYTGSTAVGKIVMESAAKNLTPVTLELGGKSPCIIWDCSNIETAARRIVWGKFYNAGQTCVAPDYLVVPSDKEAEIVEKLKEYIIIFYGSDASSSSDFGKIINKKHHSRLGDLIDKPESILFQAGRSNPEKEFFPPTMMKATFDDKVMEDEIFGPILPVLTFEKLNEALDVIASRPNPLALYVFTDNKQVEEEVLGQVNSGGACINDTIVHLTNPYLPFGGVGESGMGAYHGKHSFDCFSHKRAILKRSFWFDLSLRYPPFSRKKVDQFKKILKLLN